MVTVISACRNRDGACGYFANFGDVPSDFACPYVMPQDQIPNFVMADLERGLRQMNEHWYGNRPMEKGPVIAESDIAEHWDQLCERHREDLIAGTRFAKTSKSHLNGMLVDQWLFLTEQERMTLRMGVIGRIKELKQLEQNS